MTEETLKRHEAVELATWLQPFPTIEMHQVPGLMELAAHQSEELGVGNQPVSDGSYMPELGPLESLGDWRSVAAVIYRKAQSLATFNTKSTDFDLKSWVDFHHKMDTAPFWLDSSYRRREATISSLSAKKAVDAVIDLAQAVASEADVQSIINSIKKIASLAVSNQGQTQKDSFQHQGVLAIKASTMNVGFIRTRVSMTYRSGKGYEQMTQKLDIVQWHGVLDLNKCKRSASTILSWDGSDVDSWAGDTNSKDEKPNDSPAWDS